MDASEIVGLLAESNRLRVVAALVLGASSRAEIGSATGMDARDTARALQRLQAAGLVDDRLAVRTELLTEAARAAAPVDDGRDDPIARFVGDGRLRGLPAQRSKRLQVLEHVAQSFEPGRHYPEQQVDAVLKGWAEGSDTDHAALRRYLVEAGLLDRHDGEYWRCGGPV